MFYRIKLTRRENGTVWFNPYYFRSRKRAIEEAISHDRYFGKKPFRLSFIGQMQPVWTAELVEYAKKPEGVFMRATPERKKKSKRKKSENSTQSEQLTKVLKGE